MSTLKLWNISQSPLIASVNNGYIIYLLLADKEFALKEVETTLDSVEKAYEKSFQEILIREIGMGVQHENDGSFQKNFKNENDEIERKGKNIFAQDYPSWLNQGLLDPFEAIRSDKTAIFEAAKDIFSDVSQEFIDPNILIANFFELLQLRPIDES